MHQPTSLFLSPKGMNSEGLLPKAPSTQRGALGWALPGLQVVPVSTLAQWAPGPVSDLHQCKAQADISTGSQLISVCLSSRRGPSTATHYRSETADPLQLLPFQKGQDTVPSSPRGLWQDISSLASALALTFCLLPVSL